MQASNTDPQLHKLNVSIDLRVVVAILVIIILAMVAMWRPWEPQGDDRTIAVTGQATLKATPDEFVFYPAYEFKNANKQIALADLSKKSDDIVSKLKSIGVPDSGIKVNSDGYESPIYRDNDRTPVYTLRITIRVSDKDLTQKVQDYLVTTTPTGSVSPQSQFSEGKRKELESKARDDATKDARAKAEQSAKNLGFGLGSVKSVNDGSGFNGPISFGRDSNLGTSAPVVSPAEQQKLSVQPGENELSYSVTVTYFVR